MKTDGRSSLSWGISTTRQMDTLKNHGLALHTLVSGCRTMDTIFTGSVAQAVNYETRRFGGSQNSEVRIKFTLLCNTVKNVRIIVIKAQSLV